MFALNLPALALAVVAASTIATPEHALHYLALGDSYTIGEGVAPAERWPAQLAARLREQGIELKDPQIVARTGWTTDELSAAMDREHLKPPYDLVSLLIGVNNQYRGRSVAEYRKQFTALLERAVKLAGGRTDRVFVLSIPDWGVTPFARSGGRDRAQIARELDAYNAAAAEICAAHAVAFVDITPISRTRGGDVQMLVDDGLHPSAAMYALWTAAAVPVVAGLLSGGTR